MPPFHFADRLAQAVQSRGTGALVGLDPRFDQLPSDIVEAARRRSDDRFAIAASAFEEFCRRIIDVVAPLVPAVKPQAAFFEQQGPEGLRALQRVIRHARRAGLIVIADAKRGDIGSTAEAYAAAFLAGADPDAAPFAADALTVNPYLGTDTLQPFVTAAEARGAGLYVLVRTSNPQAGSFQDRVSDGAPLFVHVADHVEQLSQASAGESGYGVVGAVVGATYPAELHMLRDRMPHAPFLVPGFGAQGGAAADVAPAFDRAGGGALVNSSRGINFAFSRPPYNERFAPADWEAAVEAATRDMIAQLAAVRSAGHPPENEPSPS